MKKLNKEATISNWATNQIMEAFEDDDAEFLEELHCGSRENLEVLALAIAYVFEFYFEQKKECGSGVWSSTIQLEELSEILEVATVSTPEHFKGYVADMMAGSPSFEGLCEGVPTEEVERRITANQNYLIRDYLNRDI